MTETGVSATRPAQEPEALLLVRCQRYEAEALAEFFERFHDPVFNFLAARTGEPGLAAELTTESFLRALNLLPGFRNRGAGLGPWLLRIANGRLAERLRPRGGTPAASSPPPAHLGVGVAPPLGGPEAVSLRAALDRLAPDEQEVLGLRFLARLPLHVVARATHRGTRSAQAIQARGLKNLANLLAPATVVEVA